MKAKDLFLVLLGLYSVIMTITFCKRQSELEVIHDNTSQTHTDTVYVHNRIPKELPSTVNPSTVKLPQNPIFSSVSHNQNDMPNPNLDSVAAVEINQSGLKFTLQDSLGNLSKLEYQINPQKYQYIWVNGKLTSKKLSTLQRLSIKPYVGASYRPLNNLTDVEVGLNIKTEHLKYTLGIQGFYYPKFQSNPGWDFKFGIQYEF